jgi:hypothetical protein
MIPQVFPIDQRRRVAQAQAKIVPIADERERELLLLRRIAELPLAPAEECTAPDAGLVALAAALLESDVTFGTAFGGACCSASAQRLLLTVYVAEGQNCDLSLASLCSSAAFEPHTVTLRWALKLLADGVLKLVAGPDGERALRVAPAARIDFHRWLTRTRMTLSTMTRDFAV